jgi:hypothetical protein
MHGVFGLIVGETFFYYAVHILVQNIFACPFALSVGVGLTLFYAK